MKLTKKTLKRIIKEEISFLVENYSNGMKAAILKAIKNRNDYDVEYLNNFVDPWDNTQPPEIFFHPYIRKQREIIGEQERQRCSEKQSILGSTSGIELGRQRDNLGTQLRQLKLKQRTIVFRINSLKKDGVGEDIDKRISNLIKQENELAKNISDIEQQIKLNAQDASDMARENSLGYINHASEAMSGHYVCRFSSFSMKQIIKKFETDYSIDNRQAISQYVDS